MAALEKLVSVRCRLVEEVLEYLADLITRVVEPPRFLRADQPDHVQFGTIRQMVRVVENRSELERLRAAGQHSDYLAYAPARARPEADFIDGTHRDRLAPAPPVPWDDHAGERFRRAVILGDPGSGKTWLLRYESHRLASRAIEQLENRSSGLGGIVLPIFVRLPTVSDHLARVDYDDRSLEDTLVMLASGRRSDAFRDLVRAKFAAGRCAVLLDAWDEVEHGDRPLGRRADRLRQLEDGLEDFVARHPDCRLLLTSRIVGYAGSPVPDAQELELLAFETAEVEGFARSWFGSGTDLADCFLAMLRRDIQVRGLSRIPLMLALLVRAYQRTLSGQGTFPTRRVDLYRLCLRDLLQVWMREEKGHRGLGEGYVDAVLEMLQEVAFALYDSGREQFRESELRAEIRVWLDGPNSKHHELGDEKAADLIDGLKHAGILIAVNEQADARLLFLHRTFHEYLAASDLARRANRDGWTSIEAMVDRRVWLPAWHEIIVALAGLMHQPENLLELLADGARDDLFRHRLALAARCLAEISTSSRSPRSDLVDRIMVELLCLWFRHQAEGTEAAVRHLEEVLPRLGQVDGRVDGVPLLEWLGQQLRDRGDRRWIATEAVGRLGAAAATPAILAGLADLLRERGGPVGRGASLAIQRLGTAAATPEFLGRLGDLLRDGDLEVRDSAVGVVASLGMAAATPEFLGRLADLLHDKDPRTRRAAKSAGAAARAVGSLGAAAATPAILAGLADLLRDEPLGLLEIARFGDLCDDECVGDMVACAVGRLGAVAAIPAILGRLAVLLQDGHEHVRARAADKLGYLGDRAATPANLNQLTGLLDDESWAVSEAAIGAIVRLSVGNGLSGPLTQILNQLGARLRAPDAEARRLAAALITTLGLAGAARPDLLDGLADQLNDEDFEVRYEATSAVLRLGGPNFSKEALEVLDGFDGPWRVDGRLIHGIYGTAILLASEVVEPSRGAGVTPKIVRWVAEMLRDGDGDSWQIAAELAGQLGITTSAPEIGDRLRDSDAGVRRAAASALGHLGPAAATQKSLDRLADLLQDGAREVRAEAVEAAWRLGTVATTPQIVHRLIDLLRDVDAQVRKLATGAVSQLGAAVITPEIDGQLAEMLRDEDREVRLAAAEAIVGLGYVPSTCKALRQLTALFRDADPSMRRWATEATGRLGADAIAAEILPLLAELVRDEDRWVRQKAAQAISRITADGVRIFIEPDGKWIGRRLKESGYG
jgi:HEAT repeat protein